MTSSLRAVYQTDDFHSPEIGAVDDTVDIKKARIYLVIVSKRLLDVLKNKPPQERFRLYQELRDAFELVAKDWDILTASLKVSDEVLRNCFSAWASIAFLLTKFDRVRFTFLEEAHTKVVWKIWSL